MNHNSGSNERNPLERFSELWKRANARPDIFEFLAACPAMAPGDKAAICVIDQTRRWQAGVPLPVETYLDRFPGIAAENPLKLELIVREFKCRRQQGLAPTVDDFIARLPDLCDELRAQLTLGTSAPGKDQKCGPTASMGPTVDGKDSWRGQPHGAGSDFSGRSIDDGDAGPGPTHPEKIGRYQVLRVLGDGGFGRVYLAYDDVLQRQVAIKVPHRYRISDETDIEAYLTEARILASLEHEAIVPVYDSGRTADGLCFVVSKYIEGGDLATKAKRSPPTYAAAADLVAKIADAVHVAHTNGIVHRDIKPANILLDRHDRPYLSDFGIALKEEDYGKEQRTVGTIPYMSPEQLRGEGHLVDGRSDIFSLGVVFYELLTGKRPFRSNRLSQTAAIEPKPLRQIDDSIPKPLERICLKALSYRVTDRYSTAVDLAAELREFLRAGTHETQAPPPAGSGSSGSAVDATSGQPTGSAAVRIVPKGLRAFDREDADFFLELLPGPRDRDGLPASVQFWKSRIQEVDPDKTFRVGLIYGPSGSGKSSFLKAGVIPRLGSQIISLYVESTPLDTEARLLNALRRHFPELALQLDLTETLRAVRRGNLVDHGKKVLIVLDQFEQWLHGRTDVQNPDLLRALRQCDGTHLQCILTVRDDFWMAVTQFMADLEVRLVPTENVAAIDLFSIRHARKVLTAMGHAFGALPAQANDLASEQKSFITKSVAGLAENDRVAPVHLALFAEMVKDKVWTPATLRAVGGSKGVGVAFLDETFNGRTANPNHRLHQKAARAVLRTLVSDKGSTIKGGMRHYRELLADSGYVQQPKNFDALLHILDSELRLITPTQPEGLATHDTLQEANPPRSERYYHLTHDYLVPSLREWLTWKQKETRRGRAELLLAQLAEMWNSRPTNQSLPSFGEWLSILFFTTSRVRAGQQNRNVLRAAGRYYLTLLLAVTALAAIVIWSVNRQINRSRAQTLVESLKTARTQDVPGIVAQLGPLRSWADPVLVALLAADEASKSARLHAAMALLPVDPAQLDVVLEGLLISPAKDLEAIRDTLVHNGDAHWLAPRLRNELDNTSNSAPRRLRASAVLAVLDPPRHGEPGDHWRQTGDFMANQVIAELTVNSSDYEAWITLLRPVRSVLVPQFKQIYVDSNRPQIDRHTAAMVLGEFVADKPRELVDLALLAEPGQYAVLLPRLVSISGSARDLLTDEFEAAIPADTPRETHFKLTKRRARAAVTLLEFDRTEPLVSVLSSTGDPDLCSYAEDWLGGTAACPNRVRGLIENADTTVRAALVRSLAGMPRDRLSDDAFTPALDTMTQLFQTDPDPAVHSAAEWALRSWGQKERLAALTKELASDGPVKDREWYINHTGHTLVVFKSTIKIQTGSPPSEPGRDASDEAIQTRWIRRDFAVSTTEVTVEQFLTCFPDFPHKKKDYAPTSDCPAATMTWHRAAEYCNWLSKKEGIPPAEWCYRIARGMATPQEDYLHRTGYRLPTDVEWEYACRAGTSTSFSWGNDPELFRRYAWTIENARGRHWPVGSLCPNRFGLFDVHGNAAEWVMDNYVYDSQSHPLIRSGDDTEDKRPFSPDSERDVRGGSAGQFVPYQRSANRTPSKAQSGVSAHLGFRIARTVKASVGER
jgi:serine/threonine protein kinase/formylglycine-generating enzyme required for sulfatase activity